MMAAPRNNPVIAPPTDVQPKVLDGFCDFIVPPPGGRSDGCGSRVGVATAGVDDGNSVELPFMRPPPSGSFDGCGSTAVDTIIELDEDRIRSGRSTPGRLEP